jgi:predicted acyltransferase
MGRAEDPKIGTRLLSLDVLRGVTIAAMILVNDAGDEPSSYWPLKHAEWNGWTPTDLVFPFFLFIVGVSTAFSLASRLKRGESRQSLLKHIVWRGALLFAIGVYLNGFPYHALASWRIYGVLQRIAVCYAISAIVALWVDPRGQWAIIFGCLAGYWLMMRFVPVPGFGVPTHDVPLLDPDRNLVAWLDRKLLMGHLYEGSRDPEGLLSTIPAIATNLLGVRTGEWLRSSRSQLTKMLGMAAFGTGAILLGFWVDAWFPINKKLWTSSFVVFTAGMALVCLALCYWLVDIRGWQRWTKPIQVFGANSIAAYVFADLLAIALSRSHLQPDGTSVPLWQFIYDRFCASWLAPPDASLFFALSFVMVSWFAMWILYRNRIFLKI